MRSHFQDPQMSKPGFCRFASLFLLLATACSGIALRAQSADAVPSHTFSRVSLDKSFPGSTSGRLLLFIGPASDAATAVDINMMSPASVFVAAKEIPILAPGGSVDIDADDVVFPGPVSKAPAGNYRVQAVLDVNHSYNYDGRAAGDLVTAPVSISIPITNSSIPALTLTQVVPEPPDPLADRPDVNAALRPLDLVSPVLTQFWGREIHMRAWVLLPPHYSDRPNARYPTVYFTHGFGGTLNG